MSELNLMHLKIFLLPRGDDLGQLKLELESCIKGHRDLKYLHMLFMAICNGGGEQICFYNKLMVKDRVYF